MEVVRAVRIEDVDALFELTRQADHGLTSLQIDRIRLHERVERSVFAFHRRSERPAGEPYVLVMEDLSSSKLIGLSGVMAKTGGYEPVYAYRRVKSLRVCSQLGLEHTLESLHLQRIHDGPSEIGSLFLLPEFRGHGRGRLLSLSRFALLAQRPQRFSDRVIAQMRGVSDNQGNSPFWEALGRKFYCCDFPLADAMSTISKTFIEQLNPEYPIYLPLLSEAARDTIGRVHPETEPALALLRAEGFLETELVDIFDGGPTLECAIASLAAVQRCRAGTVTAVERHLEADSQILASMFGGFAAVLAPVLVDEQGGCVIETSTALALGVKVGDQVWTLTPYPTS
ncbi:arginine N-succinyltransferase [Planctomycetaceae bacterium SH139]